MNKDNEVSNFLHRVTSDVNLNPFHVSICAARCAQWIKNGSSPFNFSRKGLMKASRIKSTATYHKILNELITMRYLQYGPSYHPSKRSEVLIIADEGSMY
jgi:hypothetical protein